MKKSLNILLILLVIPFVGFSQKYDMVSYCVGFMSDYMGRRIIVGDGINDYSIDDFFHESNIHELLRLDTLIKENNLKHKRIEYEIKKRKKKEGCSNCHEFYDLISKELSKEINRYYRFKKDKLNSTKNLKYYTGNLKKCKILFANRKKQLSFFAGAFYRYGGIDPTGYFFKFANSINKKKIVRKIIKKYGCTIIKEFDNQKEGLHISPYILTIYFKPSKEIEVILKYETKLKDKLLNAS